MLHASGVAVVVVMLSGGQWSTVPVEVPGRHSVSLGCTSVELHEAFVVALAGIKGLVNDDVSSCSCEQESAEMVMGCVVPVSKSEAPSQRM